MATRLQTAKKASQDLFGDTTQSKSKTRGELRDLRDEIDVMLDSMGKDDGTDDEDDEDD